MTNLREDPERIYSERVHAALGRFLTAFDPAERSDALLAFREAMEDEARRP